MNGNNSNENDGAWAVQEDEGVMSNSTPVTLQQQEPVLENNLDEADMIIADDERGLIAQVQG